MRKFRARGCYIRCLSSCVTDVCAQIARGVLGDEVVDAVHETRLSEKTISHIYTTLRQMLCDFMLQRNEHIGWPRCCEPPCLCPLPMSRSHLSKKLLISVWMMQVEGVWLVGHTMLRSLRGTGICGIDWGWDSSLARRSPR